MGQAYTLSLRMPKLNGKIDARGGAGTDRSRKNSFGAAHHNFSVGGEESPQTTRRGRIIDFCQTSPVSSAIKRKAGQ